jgi:hypothetical protein
MAEKKQATQAMPDPQLQGAPDGVNTQGNAGPKLRSLVARNPILTPARKSVERSRR